MMKVFLSVIAAAFIANPAQAAEWVRSGWNADQTSYVDVSSFRRDGNVVRAWEKAIYSATNNRNWREARTLSEFDCSSKQTRILTITVYFKDGKVETESAGTDWRYVVPDTVGDSILDFVCALKVGLGQ
jgi:hypothetical protein